MTEEEKKAERMEALQEIFWKCRNTEPRLSDKDISEVLCEAIGDVEGFLKSYIKEKNRG